jgi:hypothetical protein
MSITRSLAGRECPFLVWKGQSSGEELQLGYLAVADALIFLFAFTPRIAQIYPNMI